MRGRDHDAAPASPSFVYDAGRGGRAITPPVTRSTTGPQPSVFVAHGAPTVALVEDAYTRALRDYATRLPRPRALLVVSAHWRAPGPVCVTAAARPSLIYDFAGFPEALYRLAYPCPGDPALATDLAARLTESGFPAVTDAARGLDHGCWVPLRFAYPLADIPVVQVTLPRIAAPADLVRFGQALGAAAGDRANLIGTGGIVHNLRRVRMDDRNAPVEAWAAEFDAWVAACLREGDHEALLNYRSRGPHAGLAVPTSEHLDPLFVVLGAAPERAKLRWIHEGFHHGTLSMRSFALEPRS